MKTLKEQIVEILRENYFEEIPDEILSLFKDYYPKEFVISILEVINEGYYRPEDIDDLFNRWENENRTE